MYLLKESKELFEQDIADYLGVKQIITVINFHLIISFLPYSFLLQISFRPAHFHELQFSHRALVRSRVPLQAMRWGAF